MGIKGERHVTVYTAAVIDHLEHAGYQRVNLEDLPEGVSVFRGGQFRARGFIGPRYYAVCQLDDNNCVVGWVSPHRFGSDPENPAQLAVTNSLGRARFMRDYPEFRESYLLKIHNRFTNSMDSQRTSSLV